MLRNSFEQLGLVDAQSKFDVQSFLAKMDNEINNFIDNKSSC